MSLYSTHCECPCDTDEEKINNPKSEWCNTCQMAVCVSCAENHKTCNTNVDVSQVINRIHSDPEKYASEVNDLQDGEIKNKLLAYIEHVSSGKSHPL